MSTASTSSDSTHENDWRIHLLGTHILINQRERDDEEALEEPELVPIKEILSPKTYDYIAVFIGADYCPHCKAFAPTVKQSVKYFEEKKTKVLFLSNDRTEEAFKASCKKNTGIDVIPYDLDKTRGLRDLFDLKTIPALMILKNSNFTHKTPTVVTNARNTLVADPECKSFPWVSEGPMSAWDRLFIHGKYGKWYDLGHHINPDFPDAMYMDEHAVQARAGLLNIVTWVAIINVFFWRDASYVNWLFPIVSYEFLTSMVIGMTPISPFGILGTMMAIIFHPEPHWKPAKPKRFAWGIGLVLSYTCFMLVQFRDEIGPDVYNPLVKTNVILCNLATWFESANGFCFGCFIYNTVLVPMYKLEECSECKL